MTDYESQSGGFRLDASVIMQIIGWMAAVLLTYGAVNARISVVESKQVESERRMQRIESKVDQLLDRK